MSMKKRCSMCAAFKDVSHFWRQSKHADGLDYWCKSCRRGWRFSYRAIERVAEQRRRDNMHVNRTR